MAVTSMTFDESYYLSQNPDVLTAILNGQLQSAEQHWRLFGYKELRDPNANFDVSFYFTQYPDILTAGVNPLDHFNSFGAGENRAPTSSLLTASSSFDETTYLAANADVKAAVDAGTFKSGYDHFVRYGQFESRAAQTTDGNSISTGGTSGSTFTLTTGADSGTAFTGTTGNDTFVGVIGAAGTTANGTTLNPGDNLTGGAGTDTLKISISGDPGAAPATLASFTVNSIERIEVSNFDSDATNNWTIDLAVVDSSLTTLAQTASGANGDTTFSNIKKLVNAEMLQGTGDLTLNYQASVVTGTADAMQLTLGNQTGGTFTANGIETLNVVSGTAANTVTLAGTELKTVNVSGTSNANLGTLATNVTTLNASSFTGNLTAVLNAKTDVTVTGGAGNDSLTTGAELTAGTVDGGAGTDTLALAADAHLDSTAEAARYTNFETVSISQASAASADRTFNGSLLSGLTGIAVSKVQDTTDGDADYTSNVSFTNLASTVTALTISGLSTAENAHDLTVNASAALASNTSADTLAVTLGTSTASAGATASAATGGADVLLNLDLDHYETVSLKSQGGANFLAGLDSNEMTTLTITGDKALTVAAITSATGLKSIDASAATADVVISANASTTASTITGGSGNDTFVGSTKADSVVGGAGNDNLTAGDGNDTVEGGSGNDTIDGGAGVDSLTGGDGDDQFTVATAAHFQSLASAEQIDGGAGNDTLKFTANMTLAAADIAGVKNVETFDFASTGANSVTITDAYFTNAGVTSLTIKDTEASAALTVNASALTSANSVAITANGGGAVSDSLVGGAGNDTFTFSTATSATALAAGDTITGGKGTDTLAVTLSTNNLTGVTLTNVGTIEKITVTGTGALTAGITLADGNFVTDGTTTVVGIVDASGMTGTGGFTFSGAAEDDSALSITGGAGADNLTGGDKADTIIGGNGGDVLVGGAGTDSLDGGAGDDTFTVATAAHFVGLAAAETVIGGTGNDTLKFGAAVTLSATDLAAISGIETIEFNDAASSITLTDSVFTANGATSLKLTDTSAAGALTVNASALSATNSIAITANTATGISDSLVGGAGNDSFAFSSASAADAFAAGDTVNGGSGTDTLTITTATNALTGFTTSAVSNIENITITGSKAVGTAGANLIIGDEAFATVTGAVVDASGVTAEGVFLSFANEDDSTLSITGSAVADLLIGGQKIDTIVGGAGDDTIDGGLLADMLTGGNGADTFRYTAVANSSGSNIDTITDFTSGTDKFQFTLDYNAQTTGQVINATRVSAGVEGITAVQNALSGERGQYIYDTTNSKLYVNVNNDNLITSLDYSVTVNAASTAANTIVDGDLNFSITGGSGADTITAGGGADTIVGGDGADNITAGGGSDFITIGSGQDTVSLTETTAAADTVIYSTAFAAGNTNAATITGFANGAGADMFDIGFALQHGTLTFAAGTGTTNTIAASAPVTVADNGTTAANTGVIFLLSGAGDQMAGGSTAANAVANAVTAMTSTADFAAANVATGDSMVVVLDDGTNSFVFHYVADGTAATTAAGDLELIAIINGVADAGTFATGDFI